MAGADRVVLRFVATQETADAAVLFDCRKQIAPSGQYFVRVSLVADVPNQPIVWRVERIVQRDGELDGAERRAGMAAHSRHRFEYVSANLVGYGSKLIS